MVRDVIVIGLVLCFAVGALKGFTIRKTFLLMGNAWLHPLRTLWPGKKKRP